ncbi:MAG: ribonuclease III family protein [Candidatus Thorarchaeota archaeon]
MNEIEKLRQFVKTFNITLPDNLLLETFTHPSMKGLSKENIFDYNKLEFLGDAVLDLLISEWLFNEYGDSEGKLTEYRSYLVENKMLTIIGTELGFKQQIIATPHYSIVDRDIADVVEAFFGATYLYFGFAYVKEIFEAFFIDLLLDKLPANLKELNKNPINLLQEHFQKLHLNIPKPVFNTSGDENTPVFSCHYTLEYKNTMINIQGIGKRKKEAEKVAAKELLSNLIAIDKSQSK